MANIPSKVTARIRSGGGEATVDVDRVEIGGMQIDGRTLQFLIENFLLPMYPEAAVGRSLTWVTASTSWTCNPPA